MISSCLWLNLRLLCCVLRRDLGATQGTRAGGGQDVGGAGDTPEHGVPEGGLRGGGRHSPAVSVWRRHVQGVLHAGWRRLRAQTSGMNPALSDRSERASFKINEVSCLLRLRKMMLSYEQYCTCATDVVQLVENIISNKHVRFVNREVAINKSPSVPPFMFSASVVSCQKHLRTNVRPLFS